MKKHVLILLSICCINVSFVGCASIFPVVKHESHIANQSATQRIWRGLCEGYYYWSDYNRFLDEIITKDEEGLLLCATRLYAESEAIIATENAKRSLTYADQLGLASNHIDMSDIDASCKADVKTLVEWQVVLRQAYYAWYHDTEFPNCNEKPQLAKIFLRLYNRADRKKVLTPIIAGLLPGKGSWYRDKNPSEQMALTILNQYIADGIDASFIPEHFFHRIAKNGDKTFIPHLAKLGCNLNDRAVRFTYKTGKRINLKQKAITPLQCAAIYNQTDCIEEFANYGADIDAAEPYTPLSIASFAGNIDAVKTLLDLFADPNIQDAEGGKTPVEHAIHAGYVPIVQLLLERHAWLPEQEVHEFDKHTPRECIKDVTALVAAHRNNDQNAIAELQKKYRMHEYYDAPNAIS